MQGRIFFHKLFSYKFKRFSFTLNYISSQALYYKEITGTGIEKIDFYEPLYSKNLYTGQYGNYPHLDVSIGYSNG